MEEADRKNAERASDEITLNILMDDTFRKESHGYDSVGRSFLSSHFNTKAIEKHGEKHAQAISYLSWWNLSTGFTMTFFPVLLSSSSMTEACAEMSSSPTDGET